MWNIWNMLGQTHKTETVYHNQIRWSTAGEWLLMVGEWAFSLNLHLWGQWWGCCPPGEQFPSLPVHQTGDHINTHGSRSEVLEQSGGEHGGPHHLNVALIFGQFWEMPVTTQGGLSPCMDHAISTNPGRGNGHQWAVSSCFGSTPWAVAVGLLAVWAFGCPSP